jgi:FSR family fosmidomycin resistance protein-like MFS transporter
MNRSTASPRTPDSGGTDVKAIFALWLLHFTGDLYASFISPLLPEFAAVFSLSLAQVGAVAGLSRFLMFIVQPISGYIADHTRTRLFLLGGPILSLIFIPLVGVAPGYGFLLLFVALGSAGQALFHPPAAGMISSFAGRHFGFCMSIFNMGGTLAFGVGPILISTLVRAYGLKGTLVSMAFGVPLLAALFVLIPRPRGEGLAGMGFIGSLKEALGDSWRAVANLWAIMVIRAFVSQTFMTFFPLLYYREGYSLVAIGWVVSLYTLAGALSGLVAGSLADRFRTKPIFIGSFLLAVPAWLVPLFLRGDWIFPGAFIAGFFSMAPLPLGVTMGQRLAPKGKSMVSSLMMGLALGVGGVLSPAVGWLADLFTLSAVLAWLPLAPLAAALLSLRLPRER